MMVNMNGLSYGTWRNIAFLMCVGAMLLGCILALLMIGVFLLL